MGEGEKGEGGTLNVRIRDDHQDDHQEMRRRILPG
jgi:hypothetical protein